MSWTRDPSHRPSDRRRAAARGLRHRQTEAEKRLWWHLRHRLPLGGSHFRRQVAIGPYVADFCCLSAHLIVEVDGDQHGFEDRLAHDARRDTYLAAQGFRVLRFSNREVMTALDGVLDTVLAALGVPTPIPGPSPQGGGEVATP